MTVHIINPVTLYLISLGNTVVQQVLTQVPDHMVTDYPGLPACTNGFYRPAFPKKRPPGFLLRCASEGSQESTCAQCCAFLEVRYFDARPV